MKINFIFPSWNSRNLCNISELWYYMLSLQISRGDDWQRLKVKCSANIGEPKYISIIILYYRVVFALFFIMNLVLWYEGSSAAIPFFTLVALLALWLCVSVPLTFVGAFFGFRKRAIEHPVRTNQIPRQIPEQSIYTQVNWKQTIPNNLLILTIAIHDVFQWLVLQRIWIWIALTIIRENRIT